MEKAKMLDQFEVITVDDSVESVIQRDSDGKRLRFNTDPDRFKQLASSEVAKLSQFGKLAYEIAQEEWRERKDEQRAKEEDILAIIEAGTDLGQATQRLFVENEQKGWVYRWIRPDMLRDYLSANKGYEVVKGGSERTLCNPTGSGPHVIGTKGSEELILVKRSEEREHAERRGKKRARQEELKSMPAQHRAAIERQGVRSIGDEDGREWEDRTE
jgi:hypothetical protein